MQEKASILLYCLRREQCKRRLVFSFTVSFSVTCEHWGPLFHVANEVIIERRRKRASKPRLAEERKKYQRLLQASLSYAAHRSRVSFRVPLVRDFSRYPQMETSTVLAGYFTIIPRARMGSESIAHEGERNNCFSKIQLVSKNIENKKVSAC